MPSRLYTAMTSLFISALRGSRIEYFLYFSWIDRKSTRLNSSHSQISYAVFCLKKKNPPHWISVTGGTADAGEATAAAISGICVQGVGSQDAACRISCKNYLFCNTTPGSPLAT